MTTGGTYKDGVLNTRATDPNNVFSQFFGIDAFGRGRVSEPSTIADHKQLHDNLPLFFDDQETSGSGTTSTHSTNTAASTLGVALNTAGVRVRQTFRRFNYEPGKSQLVYVTGVLGAGGSGLTTCMGAYDGENGFGFMVEAGTFKVFRRSFATGSAVDTKVSQGSFNGDNVDGSDSDFVIDLDQVQLCAIDITWLGVGPVRMYLIGEDQGPILLHTFRHINLQSVVSISTPNLPIRYEIQNDGTGAAATMEHICSSVMSEGGQEATGLLRAASTDGTHVDATSANTAYAVVGIRLKSTHLDAAAEVKRVGIMLETSSDYGEWRLLFNPSVAGTFTYSGD